MIRRAGGFALACLPLAGALACKTPAAMPEGPPIGETRHRAPIVPDELDRAAASLAVAALAADRDGVTTALDGLERAERELRGGASASGLVPAGFEAADAVRFPGRAGLAATKLLLERDDVDAASRARLERWLEDDPLALAQKRVGEASFSSFARLFNAVSEPVGKSIFSTALLPYTLGSALAHYSIDFAREDALPLQRRQALVQWERLARENPDAPEVAELAPKVAEYQAALRETQGDHALDHAEEALGDRLPDAAWFYARRARRYVDSEKAHEVTEQAEAQIAERRRVYARTLEFGGEGGELARDRDTAVAVLAGRIDPPESAMPRHVQALKRDPDRNPWGAFERTRSAERWRTTRWVLFGPLIAAPERGALGVAEWVIDLPFRIQAAALLPLRLVRLHWRDPTPGELEMAVHARRYLADTPRGEHAEEVRDWLEAFERSRENWVDALRVAEGRPGASDAELDVLRERAADQALGVAKAEKRSDLRAQLLGNVVRTFPDTRAGAEAGRAAREQVTLHTAHSVQLSRGFLLENPGVAGPSGIDLSPELLDGDPRNGELHPDGVTLIGGRELAIAVLAESGDEDDPPRKLRAQLSEPDYARLVARLEETSFRNSLLDSDDALEANAQRDVTFERARLGLASDVDERPVAEARYEYRGMRERYGVVRGRDSILPIELVVQGELDNLQLGAFPRLILPKTTPDAVLYR
ncbi:MAG TPA: hypothetical protein VKH41_14360 [Myxococcota bacterium]|nr:hypothetical protein [Myxococcota bacterium]